MPITRTDGTKILPKYPVSTKDSPRQYWVIGWDMGHSATIHRILFQPGMGGTLKAIRDLKTGEYRIWNRANPEDAERASEAVLTEPMIPERYLAGSADESFSWEEKKGYQWKSFKLINGAIVYYYPSSAKTAKPGEAVSGIWIDEDIQMPEHLKEWQDRLTDMEGWFLWSVWPQRKNSALMDLLDRAELEKDEEVPQIETFQLIMSQNPYISATAKEKSLKRMGSEDEIARRDRGDLMLNELSMYDFDRHFHALRIHEDKDRTSGNAIRDMFEQLLKSTRRIPREFTRYLCIDPSHTRTACHSLTIPPPEYQGIELGNMVICEWELVAKKHSADDLAKALLDLMSGLNYEAFIMDRRFGRQTVGGRAQGEDTFSVYEEAFEEQGLTSRTTHSGFIPGVDVISTRVSAVRRSLMTQEKSGLPMLLLCENTTWETQREFERYRKKTEYTDGQLLIYDTPANPRVFDCMNSLEYGMAYLMPLILSGEAYQDPSVYRGKVSKVMQKALEILKKQKDQDSDFVHFGPGSG